MKKIALMFHDVYRETPSESGFSGVGPDLYKMSEKRFEGIIQHLYERSKDEEFILTFDDGGVSFFNTIAPILEKYNFKGLFFIATGSIGEEGFLTKEQIADLDRRGHVIGSHSHTHRRLSSIPQNEVENEWRLSKKILESIIKHPITIASIPNGYQSDFVLTEALKCGYTDMYTSEPTCIVKSKGELRLHGRFVLMKDSSISDVDKLSSGIVRGYLNLRSRVLMLFQRIMGPYYKKLRNIIVK